MNGRLFCRDIRHFRVELTDRELLELARRVRARHALLERAIPFAMVITACSALGFVVVAAQIMKAAARCW